MIHFNWTQLIPGVAGECPAGQHCSNYVHVATLVLASAVLLVIGVMARVSLGKGEAAVMPASSFSIKGIFETITEFIISLCDMVIGEDGRKFAPAFCAVFLFVFFNNFVGLIPGMTPATDNLNTTFAMGLFMFLVYNYYGFREHGPAYLKQFLGPYLPLAVLMVVIEVISHLVRPMSLGLRLQGNMQGDHTVLGIFLDLAPAWLPLPTVFYCLGLFVCFMQAFVFTMLSMVYVSMAISHDH